MDKNDLPKLGVIVGRRSEVVYARVRPETKEWLVAQQGKAGAYSLGEYLDHLVEKLQEIK